MDERPILVASHGTAGARAAEQAAIGLCAKGAALHHLVVVPPLWRGMTGDDWLNNAATQIRFGNYAEEQLEREIMEEVARFQAAVEDAGLDYRGAALQGDPAESLVAAAAKEDYRMVVIGAPRPKGEQGIRSRMNLDTLARGMRTPLLIVPRPGR